MHLAAMSGGKAPPEPGRPWAPLTLALAAASFGCLLMVVLRVAVTGSIRYAPLLWNLFLAWIPYFLALAVRRVSSREGFAAGGSQALASRVLAVLLAVAWLFFYPNAPYILTDFIHVIRAPGASQVAVEPRHPLITANALLWYDIILHSAFAFIGHIIGLISLLVLHRTIRRRYDSRWGWVFVGVATGLGGYGIYLGRFERLNSWDIVQEPLRTLRTAMVNLANPKAVLVSACFALFIFLTYLAVASLYETARRDET